MNTEIETILLDPSVHNWVKDVIRKMCEKDPIDNFHNAKLIMKVAEILAK